MDEIPVIDIDLIDKDAMYSRRLHRDHHEHDREHDRRPAPR